MSKITIQEIQKQLIKLSIHYPEAGHDAEMLYSLAEDYFDAVKTWEPGDFSKCMKWARENCKFWPKIAEIKEAYLMIRQSCNLLALPEKPSCITEEEACKNAEVAKIYGRVVAKELTMDEAKKLVDEIRDI